MFFQARFIQAVVFSSILVGPTSASCHGPVADEFYFRPWTLASNLLDPRYRGELLGHERKRATISFVLQEGWETLMGTVDAPPLEEVLHFLEL